MVQGMGMYREQFAHDQIIFANDKENIENYLSKLFEEINEWDL